MQKLAGAAKQGNCDKPVTAITTRNFENFIGLSGTASPSGIGFGADLSYKAI